MKQFCLYTFVINTLYFLFFCRCPSRDSCNPPDVRRFLAKLNLDYHVFYVTVRALVRVARNPDVMVARAEIDTYWASLRSAAFPSELLNAVWLVDPRRCSW